jgi:hypothetical protein
MSENLPSKFSSPKYHFSIKVDSDFEKSPKLLQTHEFEIFFKSTKIKGLSFGVTVMTEIYSEKNIVYHTLTCLYIMTI